MYEAKGGFFYHHEIVDFYYRTIYKRKRCICVYQTENGGVLAT